MYLAQHTVCIVINLFFHESPAGKAALVLKTVLAPRDSLGDAAASTFGPSSSTLRHCRESVRTRFSLPDTKDSPIIDPIILCRSTVLKGGVRVQVFPYGRRGREGSGERRSLNAPPLFSRADRGHRLPPSMQ